jgi:hypothetical protein
MMKRRLAAAVPWVPGEQSSPTHRRSLRSLCASLTVPIALASCVIIIEPGGNTPTPIPPLSCSLEALAAEAPIVHIYFAMRIERSTVNLADRYSQLMQDTSLALAAIGANVTTGVLVREDERPVPQPLLAAWGCVLDDPTRLVPADVIRWYATNVELDDDELGCAIDPLVEIGARLSDVVTQYPPELAGTSGQRVFSSAPELVLVVHVDSLGRKTGFDEPACADATRAITAGGNGDAPWLAYAGSVAQDRIVHWFINTDELVSRESFVASCKSVDGFPSSVLDTLEESKKALYGPLAQAVAESGGAAASLPMCKMLVEPEERMFVKSQVKGIANMLGLPFDEKRVSEVLEGGFPALMPPPEGAGELAIPGTRPGT